MLLAEGQLADSPDLGILDTPSKSATISRRKSRKTGKGQQLGVGKTYRLQGLLDLLGEGPGLDGDDGRRGLGIVGNVRAALAAEDAVHGLARGADVGVALGGARDGHLVLLEDSDEGWRVLAEPSCVGVWE